MLVHPNLTSWIQTTVVYGSHPEAVQDACVKTVDTMYYGLTKIFIPYRLDDNTLQKVNDLIKLCSPFPCLITDWQLLNGSLNPPCSVFDMMNILYNGEYEEYDESDCYGMTPLLPYLKYSN